MTKKTGTNQFDKPINIMINFLSGKKFYKSNFAFQKIKIYVLYRLIFYGR